MENGLILFRLRPRQWELLQDLARQQKPVAPIDLGGGDGTHHSHTLAALCKKGLASRRKYGITGACGCKVGPTAQFGHRCKGSCLYEITTKGREIVRITDQVVKLGRKIHEEIERHEAK